MTFLEEQHAYRIEAWLDRAENETLLVGVEGVGGIGKSHFLAELIRSATTRGLSCCSAKADPWDRDRPLAIVEQITGARLSTALSGSSQTAEREAEETAQGQIETFSPLPIQNLRLVEQGADAILAGIHQGRQLVVVDDLDLCEQTDHEIVARVRSAAIGYPVLVVVSGRSLPSGVAMACDELLQIEALSESQAETFAQQQLGAKPGPLLAKHLDRCGGIGAVIAELMQFAKADDLLVSTGDRIDLCTDDLPPTMIARLQRRLAQLGEMPTTLAQVASVVAGPIDMARCMSVAGLSAGSTQPAFSFLVEAEIFTWKQGQLEWVHELTREAVLASLSPKHREDLERKTARWLISVDAPPEQVLSYLESSGAPELELIPWLERVGNTSPSNQARCRALRVLVGCSPEHAKDLSLLRNFATSAVEASDRSAFYVALDASIAADARDGFGWVYKITKLVSENRMHEAIVCAQSALGVVADKGDRAKVLALTVLARMTILDGPVLDLVNEAVELADRSADVNAVCAAYTIRSRVAGNSLDAHSALQFGLRSLAAVEHSGPIDFAQYQPHFFAALASLECDLLDAGIAIVAEGRQRSLELGSIGWSDPILSAIGARIRLEQGERNEAVSDASTAVAAAKDGDVTLALLPAYAVLIEAAVHDGDMEAAEAFLVAADEVLAVGGVFGIEHLTVARANVLVRKGQPDKALDELWGVWQLLDIASVHVAMFDLVPSIIECALQAQRTDVLQNVVVRGEELAQGATGSPRLVPLMQWAAAMLHADVDRIISALRSLPVQRVRLLATLQAIAVVQYPAWAEKISSAHISVATSRQTPTPSLRNENIDRQRFTVTERLVAESIAKGRSNREIAAECFMGIRTVETHVANVLRKLGVRTRVQAAVELRPQ
jgi:DNA-binding CsgD family transcriptional regulator